MLTNDTPITAPEDDRFGIDPFAQALARAISEMPAPKGVVIAVNGAWGTGKSSALQLILFHLNSLIEQKKLRVIRFSPWWLSGTNAITAAFFSDLEAAIGQSLGKLALDALQKVTKRVLRFGRAAETAADMYVPGAGKAVEGVTHIVKSLLPAEDDIETQHRKISELLEKADQRFLVLIDDIDRLAPDEAIQVFKLVKSVGQLPNILYVLAFDRELAEKVVSEKYPSEGPHYLEKIVQAAFEVPAVSPEDLRAAFITEVSGTCAAKEDEDPVRAMNIIYGLVTPLLKSPRDLKRLIGMLQVTWPAVSSEVDRADFIAMEALRLFRPNVYTAIRASPDRLTGGASSSANRPARDFAAEYDDFLLRTVAEEERAAMRLALPELFPRLAAVWSNTHYTADADWRRRRLVCTPEHFPTYFRFALGDGLLPAKSIAELLQHANDRDFIQAALRGAIQEKLKSGRTRSSAYLEEMTVHASEIDKAHISTLISAIFEIADELDVEADQVRMYDLADNRLRIYWLLNALVRGRMERPDRTRILRVAMKTASLHWFCDFAERCGRDHKPDRNGHLAPEDERYVDQKTADAFLRGALRRIRRAAKDGSLAKQRQLVSLLYEWVRLAPKGMKEVRPKVAKLLANDDFVAFLALDTYRTTWSHGAGDLVARARTQINKEPISDFTNPNRFLARIREAIEHTDDPTAVAFLVQYLEAWEQSSTEPD